MILNLSRQELHILRLATSSRDHCVIQLSGPITHTDFFHSHAIICGQLPTYLNAT